MCIKGLPVAEAPGTPASLSCQDSLAALTQAPGPLYLRTCPVGEAGPEYCGQRSAQAPRGHVSQQDLPQPLGAVRPLAPAGAAGQPCLPHRSPHPRGKGWLWGGSSQPFSAPLCPGRPPSLGSWAQGSLALSSGLPQQPHRARRSSPARPAHMCARACAPDTPCPHAHTHTFTSHVPSRPTSPPCGPSGGHPARGRGTGPGRCCSYRPGGRRWAGGQGQ